MLPAELHGAQLINEIVELDSRISKENKVWLRCKHAATRGDSPPKRHNCPDISVCIGCDVTTSSASSHGPINRPVLAADHCCKFWWENGIRKKEKTADYP